jgi:hypothetical protein
MAQADTSIYNALLQQPKSALDYQKDYAAQDDARQVRQLNALQLQGTQEKVAADALARSRQNMMYGDLSAAGADASPEQLAGIYQRYGDVTSADKVLSSASAREKSGYEAKAAALDITNKKFARSKELLGSMVNDPESAAHWVRALYDDPELGQIARQQGPLEMALSKIPQTPAEFAQWKANSSLGIDKVAERLKQQTNNVGGATVTQVFNPFTQALSEVGRVANTQSPDNAATNANSSANNAATNAAHLQGIKLQQVGENARAGITPDGGISPDMETTARAIASGQLPPPSGMALLNPKNQRILARVMEINPEYDATTVAAKRKAASDFTTGTLGNSMRSFAVAGQHLDQLGELVDAMDNRNSQLVNTVKNKVSQWSGGADVTNFDAAKYVVAKEVIKAIVAGGGGVSEREELSRTLASAKSSAQLKGVIQQYRNLMSAQHDALLTQRRAAGLPDSTMPNYAPPAGAGGSPSVPPDIQALLDKHGGN